MIPIVMFSHGKYAAATKETAEMIMGELEEVYTLSLNPGGSVSDLELRLEEIIKKHDGKIIILCDILGGSPSNITFRLKQKYTNIISYTGFNLPIILELVGNRKGTTDEIKELIKSTFLGSLNEIEEVTTEKENDNIMDL